MINISSLPDCQLIDNPRAVPRSDQLPAVLPYGASRVRKRGRLDDFNVMLRTEEAKVGNFIQAQEM